MATIIELGDGSFIAGEPVEQLGEREHWCGPCAGSGLTVDYFSDAGLEVCQGCFGSGSYPCDGWACDEHEYVPAIEPTPELITRDAEQANRMSCAAASDGDGASARYWALEFALHRDAALTDREREVVATASA